MQFTLPGITIHQVMCERLEAIDRETDAIDCFLEMMNKLGGEVYVNGPMTEWVSGEFMFYLSALHSTFLSDFIHRCLSAPGSDAATTTPLLKEWVRTTLARRSWKDALVAAASVSILFCSGTPRQIDTLMVCSSHFPQSRCIRSYVNIWKRLIVKQMQSNVSTK